MVNTKMVRDDLKEIRYYYSRKELFDSCLDEVGKLTMVEKVTKYNKAICFAPPRLYDLYVTLYLQNNTQESLAEKLCYSNVYISKLNSDLIKFFQKHLEEVENA